MLKLHEISNECQPKSQKKTFVVFFRIRKICESLQGMYQNEFAQGIVYSLYLKGHATP